MSAGGREGKVWGMGIQLKVSGRALEKEGIAPYCPPVLVKREQRSSEEHGSQERVDGAGGWY